MVKINRPSLILNQDYLLVVDRFLLLDVRLRSSLLARRSQGAFGICLILVRELFADFARLDDVFKQDFYTLSELLTTFRL